MEPVVCPGVGRITNEPSPKRSRPVVNGPIEPVVEDEAFAAKAAEALPPAPWDASTWKTWTDAIKAATGAKGKALFMPLRLALTGVDHGPELAALLPLIGPERARARLAGKAT